MGPKIIGLPFSWVLVKKKKKDINQYVLNHTN